MKTSISVLVGIILINSSCNQKAKKSEIVFPDTNLIEANIHLVSKDSVEDAKVIPSGKPVIVKAGIPEVIPVHKKIDRVVYPAKVVARAPEFCTPGEDSFLLPKRRSAIENEFITGDPETATLMLRPETGGHFPGPLRFRSFDKYYVLDKLNVSYPVNCMIEDKAGMLWFGTFKGLFRFDGKTLLHFKVNEEFGTNIILCLFEDRNGNLWLGTDGSGIYRCGGKDPGSMFEWSHYTTKEGLIDDHVYSIAEDKNGNLWFGTSGGVSKYEAKSPTSPSNFIQYTEKEGLSNNFVTSIIEDKAGNLWLGTRGGGVNKFDGKSFAHYTQKTGLSNNFVNAIVEDQRGNVWFATDSGACKLNFIGNRSGDYFTYLGLTEGLSDNFVGSIIEDKSGNLWFGTDKGMCKFDPDEDGGSGVITAFTGKNESNIEVNSILEDEKEAELFWKIGQAQGGHLGKTYIRKNNVNDKLIYVRAIMEDKNGNIWYTTKDQGLNKYNGNYYSNFPVHSGRRSDLISCILEDHKGSLWIGSNQGISRFGNEVPKRHKPLGIEPSQWNNLTHYTEKEGLINNSVTSISDDKEGNLWIGTLKGVSRFNGEFFSQYTIKQGLIHDHILTIFTDKSGNLWFGTEEGLSKFDGKSFRNYTTKQGLLRNMVYSIFEDKAGNLWFGYQGSGVTKYNPSGYGTTPTFTHYKFNQNLSNNEIYTLLEDTTGNLWFGNWGGVIKYDGKSFSYFTKKDGLGPDVIRFIVQDRKNDLLFATHKALYKLGPKLTSSNNEKEQVSLFPAPILPFLNLDIELITLGRPIRSILEGSSGVKWIASNNDLMEWNPGAESLDSGGSKIQLVDLALFGEKMVWPELWPQRDTLMVLRNGVKIHDLQFKGLSGYYNLPINLSLPFNNNSLTFYFLAINPGYSEKIYYQTKMEGLEKYWNGLSNLTEISYSNLPSGVYTFKVKAINNSGHWSKEINYTFIIRPPWWKTWWAYGFYILILYALVVIYIRTRISSIKKQKKILEEKVVDRTQQLQQEKQKSENLLLNILPLEIAEELKATGKAEAKDFDPVTILFSDFKEFTQLSEKLSAKELVAEINHCFVAFDLIINKYQIEKIKTIGDAYMAAGGLPVPSSLAVKNTILAALEMQLFIQKRKLELEASGAQAFEMRIGIHTGPVVAGIVGLKKYQYDMGRYRQHG